MLSEIDLRRKKYQDLKLKCQPCVGSERASLEDQYISCESQIWKVPNCISTLEFLFNFSIISNLEYAVECKHILTLLQQFVYKIYTNHDMI